MTQQVYIRFYEELNDFLPADQHQTAFYHALKKPRSIKDLIESIGIPHTEVDHILVNGVPVYFDYQVESGDQISVYPISQSPDISPLKHCQPDALTVPRFVLDVHLGRLAAYLRMSGFDTLYRNDYDDPELADISANENRILLTCDRLLLMRRQVNYGYFVRARQPQIQLQEIVSHFDLYDRIEPFSRCMSCNGRTQMVEKDSIKDQLLPKTIKYYDEFFQCGDCNKIYWKGSHYQKMQVMIDKIKVTAT